MTTLTNEQLRELANASPHPSAFRVSVLYGEYGRRKTSTACSMVHERGLLLSSDDSWKVLLNDRHRDAYSRITKTIQLQGLAQLDYIDLDGYDTIIWDTMSRSVRDYITVIHNAVNWGGKFRESPVITKSKLGPFDKPIVSDNLAPVDYLACRDGFEPVLNRLFDTKAHIIFTSQMTEPVQGLSKDQRYRPMIPSATFQLIAERADLIAQLGPYNKNFVADMSTNDSTMLGKSRIEGLEGRMPLDTFVSKYKEIVFK